MEPGTTATEQEQVRLAVHRSLIRYRVMAYVTATLLIVLVFVGVPLQLAANEPRVANVVGTGHGILYIVYLFAAFDLTRRLGLRITKMALVLLAGTVPFCAIVSERLLTRMVDRSEVFGSASTPPEVSADDRRASTAKETAASVHGSRQGLRARAQ